MFLRYDFGEKLDLSKFRKQCKYYIDQNYEMRYWMIFPRYKMVVDITKFKESLAVHQVDLAIYDIVKKDDGTVIGEASIAPASDDRFKSFESVRQIFMPNLNKTSFGCNNSDVIADKICSIIKIVHKIDGLKAFL